MIQEASEKIVKYSSHRNRIGKMIWEASEKIVRKSSHQLREVESLATFLQAKGVKMGSSIL